MLEISVQLTKLGSQVSAAARAHLQLLISSPARCAAAAAVSAILSINRRMSKPSFLPSPPGCVLQLLQHHAPRF